jgi:hypothetical protein
LRKQQLLVKIALIWYEDFFSWGFPMDLAGAVAHGQGRLTSRDE